MLPDVAQMVADPDDPPRRDRNILFFAIILSAVLPIVPTPIEQEWSLGFHAGSRMGFARVVSPLQQDASTIKTPHQPCFSRKSVYLEVPFGGLEWDFHGFSKASKADVFTSQPLLGHPGTPLRFLKPMMYVLLGLDSLFFLEAIRMGGLKHVEPTRATGDRLEPQGRGHRTTKTTINSRAYGWGQLFLTDPNRNVR